MSAAQLVFTIFAAFLALAIAAIAWILGTRIFARRIRAAIAYHTEEIIRKEATNIQRELQRRALRDTADFVQRNLATCTAFTCREDLLDFALKQVPTELQSGVYCEFGVYTGSTIRFIAERVQTVHGFDSFEGLPENWRSGHQKGTFKVISKPDVQKNVKLHVGWFHETLPAFVQQAENAIAFLHIDSDLYSSSKTVLEHCSELIVPGTVIVFDEFFNYHGWREGEYKAFSEFVAAKKVEFDWIGYNSRSEQVALRIAKIPAGRLASTKRASRTADDCAVTST